MDSSKLFGGTEECHSSESGWTMYIGSPIHSDDGDDVDDGHSDGGDDNNDDDAGDDSDANHEDYSDDSMASDASSGPSHQGNPYGNGGHGIAHFKHEKDKGNGKRANKAVEKHKAERGRKEEKEEIVLMATRANTASQSGSKVRKNIWKGKRK